MTRRSLRFALAGVPLLLAVGMAAACGPYVPPGCNVPLAPSCPTPGGPPALPQAPVCPPGYASPPVAPPAPPVWALSVLDGKLQLQTAEGARSLCERLTMLVNGADPVEVTVKGARIRLACGKDCVGACSVQAGAERVTRTGVDGALVALGGERDPGLRPRREEGRNRSGPDHGEPDDRAGHGRDGRTAGRGAASPAGGDAGHFEHDVRPGRSPAVIRR